jgi:hypothetical protein
MIWKKSGDMVLHISLGDVSQGSSGRLCSLNQVNQAEEPIQKESAPMSSKTFCHYCDYLICHTLRLSSCSLSLSIVLIILIVRHWSTKKSVIAPFGMFWS